MQRYQITGTVCRVDTKRIGRYTTFDVSNEHGKLPTIHHDQFLPIRYGDKIKGIVREDNGKYFLESSEVEVPTDENSILNSIKFVLRTDYPTARKVINLFKQLRITGEDLTSYISRAAQSYCSTKDEEWLEPFSFLDFDRPISQFYTWWIKNHCQRKLYLLGITKTEIRQSGLKLVELYDRCLLNPFTISSIEIEKCKTIRERLGQKWTEQEYQCGQLLRFVCQKTIQRGNSYVLAEIIDRNFPWSVNCRDILTRDYQIMFDDNRVYLYPIYAQEVSVASFIIKLLNQPVPDFKPELPEHLSEDQKNAVLTALNNNVSIITGEAGTGKTSVLTEILRQLEKVNIKTAYGAYTGKAVARIRKKTGRQNARTLHRMIKDQSIRDTVKNQDMTELTEKQKRALEQEEPECLIVDEASMLTTGLMAEIISTFRNIKKVVLIGDNNQLPPIGHGALFEQLLISRKIPLVKLTTNFRISCPDGSQNGILVNARQIINHRVGEPFQFVPGNNIYFQQGNMDNLKAIIGHYASSGIDPQNIIFITPFNRDIDEINLEAQKRFDKGSARVVDSRGNLWVVGDQVIMTENDYDIDVFNGESGVIVSVDKDKIVVDFDDGRVYDFPLEIPNSPDENFAFETDEFEYQRSVKKLKLAYSLTVHKSQGSEWKDVVFYIPSTAKPGEFLNKLLIYTAITRPQQKILIIYDNFFTLQHASVARPRRRLDGLAERLSSLPDLQLAPESYQEIEHIESEPIYDFDNEYEGWE